MTVIFETDGAWGSGPTLDEAVADAIDRFEMVVGGAIGWGQDFDIQMTMTKVEVAHRSERHSYSHSAPSVIATFHAVATAK